MTILPQLRIATITTAVVTTLLSAGASAVLPQGEFACQVETTGGDRGLILVQSDSKQEAVATARVGTVVTVDGGRAAVAEVVQCISRRTEERFRDADFQMQYMKTPL